MPQTVTVIRLSDDERETLRQAASADQPKAIAKAVSDALRTGNDQARQAAQAVEMDPARLRSLRAELNTRLGTLAALPVPDEVKQPLAASTQAALSLVDEALSLLGE